MPPLPGGARKLTALWWPRLPSPPSWVLLAVAVLIGFLGVGGPVSSLLGLGSVKLPLQHWLPLPSGRWAGELGWSLSWSTREAGEWRTSWPSEDVPMPRVAGAPARVLPSPAGAPAGLRWFLSLHVPLRASPSGSSRLSLPTCHLNRVDLAVLRALELRLPLPPPDTCFPASEPRFTDFASFLI